MDFQASSRTSHYYHVRSTQIGTFTAASLTKVSILWQQWFETRWKAVVSILSYTLRLVVGHSNCKASIQVIPCRHLSWSRRFKFVGSQSFSAWLTDSELTKVCQAASSSWWWDTRKSPETLWSSSLGIQRDFRALLGNLIGVVPICLKP